MRRHRLFYINTKKEYFMKNKQTLVCGFLAVMFALSFFGCKGRLVATAAAQEQPQELRVTGSSSFKFTPINGGTAYSVSGGSSREGTVNNIPAYYRPNADSDFLPVTEIGERAFANGVNIIKIIIPSTVTTIGNNAFQYCRNLNSITLPAGLKSINSGAFFACNSLASITFSAGLKSIGSFAFFGCNSLTNITIPAGVTLDGGVFSSWSSSQTIYIEGHANRESTIAAGWSGSWDTNARDDDPIEAKIIYKGK
jgi:hypothetical protein